MPLTKKNNKKNTSSKKTIKISRKSKNINIKHIKIQRKSKKSYDNNDDNNNDKKDETENESKDIANLNSFRPPNNPNKVHPKIWELPNRKHFYNWVIDTFQQYELGNTKKQKREIPKIKERLELNNIQKLTRDYLQGESPARGLLLYIGLGVGKTCAAITISEAILTKKEVIIMSKTNLDKNFQKGIRNCGSEYVKTANYWVFNNCKSESHKKLADELGIPSNSINENDGAFFVDFTKTHSNYNELSSIDRTKLDYQIKSIIDKRFKFVHYDNPRILTKLKDGDFDDKVVIIDEVHNMGNRMASGSANGDRFYDLFINAKNPKYIFLSGTPITNQIYEITKIYNILRGYMNVIEIKIKTTFDVGIDYTKIKYNLKKNVNLDQIIINQSQKIIKVTKNPDNFITNPDGKGIIYKPDESIDFDSFRTEISDTIKKMGYKISIDDKAKPETCFPEDKEEFERLFYNPELNKLKRIDLIKRRIAGLTSYYEYQEPSQYPDLVAINKVQVPMSEFQFASYERYRHQEIEKDKTNRRRQDEENTQSLSSYRISSRLACSLVFPEEIGSPYDSKLFEDKLGLLETLGEQLEDFNIRASQAEIMKREELNEQIKKGYLNLLEKDKAKYLDVTNGSLAKYAPKYLAMITNIENKSNKGKILVYSYFLTLIGLNTFSFALIQTGKWAPFSIKKVKGGVGDSEGKGGRGKNNYIWELEEKEEDKHKSKFIFYTGEEDNDIREIYRNIYNSEWDKLPQNCNKLVSQLKAIHSNNYYGEVIKMLMTTKTGAEGLDLKEVRYIHILEPYWQNVLIQQVIGRGIRNKSHLALAPKDRNCEVFIYMATITPNLVRKISYVDVRTNDIYKYSNPALADKAGKIVSSDEYLYLTAQRKKIIINEFQKLMKETAFDCALNYKENILNPDNKGLVCMDYATKNRDEYLFTPAIDDTVDTIDLAQEKVVTIQYGSFPYKGKIYYYNTKPDTDGKMNIYDENLVGRVRIPKPVGEVRIVNGKKQFVFFTKKKK
jgi:superfamily II DNA or RNA helicase